MFGGNIYVSPGFQTAINVAYDLNSEEKVASFIPTDASLNIIKDIMYSTAPSSNQRARILVGAYGRGKSHLILQLLSILSKRNISGIEAFLEKIKPNYSDLHDLISSYLEGNQRLFPIIIDGNSMNLTQSFLNAIRKSLLNEGLGNFMPTTGFSLVYSNIQKWKTEFPNTYKEFRDCLDCPIQEFEIKIKNHDQEAYESFLEIYPKITSGSQFNPFANSNVLDILDEVTAVINPLGYSGIFIVYDEFSKYLEANIVKTAISDIKLLQDLAEKSNRSDERQIHLLLVSHKDISNYIDVELPKDKVDGWRGVSGRFEHIYISNSFTQIYDVITSVIEKKEPYWSKFLLEHSNLFNTLVSTFSKVEMFKGTYSISETINGCFPLHPVSTFILPRLSEKVAQNERTLFTFLSSTGKHTLNDFLSTSSSPLMTPDWIYDYFEPLLRQEPPNSGANISFILSQRIISQLENELEIMIIKTIALIDIVEQFELLPPTLEMIVNTYAQLFTKSSMVQEALENLITQKHLVYLSKSSGFMKLKESSGVNIYQKISDEKERSRSLYQVEQIINRISKDTYFYPIRYNIEKSITRYFNFVFISAEVFLQTTDWNYYLQQTLAEGIVFAILSSSPEDDERVRTTLLQHKLSSRIFFIISKRHATITEAAFEYVAVECLLQEAINLEDKVLASEYNLILQDLEVVIDNFTSIYTSPHRAVAEYFYQGTQIYISRRSQISERLSIICEDLFPLTPIINNESINKHVLPIVAINSRKKILNALFEPVLSENLGLSGNGQDVSMMRSTLLRTKILESKEERNTITLVENTSEQNGNISKVLNYIGNFIRNTQESTSFQEMYHHLTHPEHGIGLKLGVIPIYIALCLRPYLEFLVITQDGKELRINADLLGNINKNPSNYYLKIINWDKERELYFSELENIFSDYSLEEDRLLNRFTYVYEAMKRWYMSLPQYSKQSQEVYLGLGNSQLFDSLPISSQKFLKSFSHMSRNPQEFLVDDMPSYYNFDKTSKELAKAMEKSKKIADEMIKSLLDVLAIDIRFLFSNKKNLEASLYTIINDWTDSLSVDTFQHIFPENEGKMLDLLKEIGHNEHLWISKLAHVTTSLRIEDWKQETIVHFTENLILFKIVIEAYESSEKSTGEHSSYQLTITQNNGIEEIRTFDRVTYEGRANLLFNEIHTAMLDMGQSISQQEKRQVLMDVLEQLL